MSHKCKNRKSRAGKESQKRGQHKKRSHREDRRRGRQKKKKKEEEEEEEKKKKKLRNVFPFSCKGFQ